MSLIVKAASRFRPWQHTVWCVPDDSAWLGNPSAPIHQASSPARAPFLLLPPASPLSPRHALRHGRRRTFPALNNIRKLLLCA